jgi:hypothetical protein
MSEKMITYSLSLEELSMCLAMLNRPDLGQTILRTYYDNLTKEQVDSRMTAASHSLLARGICGLTPEGTPRLEKDLEQAILPIAVYDLVFQFNLVTGDNAVNSNIHVRKGKTFTSHNVQVGVIHLLEHGAFKQLPDFLLDVLEDYGGKEKIDMSSKTTITLAILGQALNASTKKEDAYKILQSLNWDASIIKALGDDLSASLGRGTLVRVEAKSGTDEKTLEEAPKRTLLFLKGKMRTWCFEFTSPKDDAVAQVKSVTRKEFSEIITAFLN